jgi:hypothetical protein
MVSAKPLPVVLSVTHGEARNAMGQLAELRPHGSKVGWYFRGYPAPWFSPRNASACSNPSPSLWFISLLDGVSMADGFDQRMETVIMKDAAELQSLSFQYQCPHNSAQGTHI